MTITPTNAWLSLTGVLVALVVNVFCQVAHCRLARGRNLLGTITSGFITGFSVLVVWEAGRWRGEIVTASALVEFFCVNIPLYGSLGYCYANLVLVGRSSVRMRIYQEICHSPSGLDLPQLRRIYDERKLIRMRIQRLSESGDIREVGRHYQTGRRRLVWIADLIFGLKRLVLSKDSEFQSRKLP